jgi:AraC-like DNA-binding protein
MNCGRSVCFRPIICEEELQGCVAAGFWSLLVSPMEEETRACAIITCIFRRSGTAKSKPDRRLNRERGRMQCVPRSGAGLFFRLLVFLARQHAQQRTRRDTSTRDARQQAHNVAEVLQFCDEHFCESLSVPQLAAMMFLSPGRFSEVFAREVGMPPATYLRRCVWSARKRSCAQRRCRQPRSRTAAAFSDLAQLSRAFRAVFGTTPSTYRATYKT